MHKEDLSAIIFLVKGKKGESYMPTSLVFDKHFIVVSQSDAVLQNEIYLLLLTQEGLQGMLLDKKGYNIIHSILYDYIFVKTYKYSYLTHSTHFSTQNERKRKYVHYLLIVICFGVWLFSVFKAHILLVFAFFQ